MIHGVAVSFFLVIRPTQSV